MNLIIERGKWRCGGKFVRTARGLGVTQLLNNEGYMCCLGQISLQTGVNQEALVGVASPEDVSSEVEEGFDFDLLRFVSSRPGCRHSLCDTDLSTSAIIINDDDQIDDAQRERELLELFREHGHAIEFTGDYFLPTLPSSESSSQE